MMASTSGGGEEETLGEARSERRKRLLERAKRRYEAKRRRVEIIQKELKRMERRPLSKEVFEFEAKATQSLSPPSEAPLSPKTRSSASPLQSPRTPRSPRASSSSSSSSVVVKVRARAQTRHEVACSASSASARHEAHILGRVAALQKQGLWTSQKKMAKGVEPEVAKSHWDFVLQEMEWLGKVINNETKTKKANAKKCARMVQKHFADKAMAEVRAERELESNRRKVAAFMAREVRTFWTSIQKLVEFRIQSHIEEKRKAALDEHLNMIVVKTEKFSSLLAESLEVATPATTTSLRTTPTASDVESVTSSRAHANDAEYNPENSDSDDDEATITKEDDHRDDDEIDMLQQEQDIPVEDLLKKFHPDLYAKLEQEAKKQEDCEETKSEAAEQHDAREAEQHDAKKAEQQDAKKTEQQDAKKAEQQDAKKAEQQDVSKAEQQDAKKAEQQDAKKAKSASDRSEKDIQQDKEDQDNLKMLASDKVEEAKEQEGFYETIEMAEQFQPTGNTLDTTNVKTKIPFLLKHTLREYQHIGLDWLVSLHERNFNGILADEMGLGKTIQTIALLAHLACDRGVWGPHLIVVPTSVMLNWEMEIKKWCPAFKVLTYYGSQKERRLKRVGWTKQNAFHVCITSYKLVIQDHQSFRRKKWYYFILDEAQHIKNFKSQRWQLLLNFQSEGRLLLTGTPLQNNLMELWSLMHFLMPNVFQSHRNFKEWFSNPLTGMVEDSQEYNESLVKRLHKVLRPFLLRRLKNEVEKQLPQKYEHVVYCHLSKRQRFLYDDFMSRAKTRETLEGGNFMSVINVLMQLRKVCNHPNLFEPRPTLSPFVCEPLSLNHLPRALYRLLEYRPLQEINLQSHPVNLLSSEMSLTGYASFAIRRLQKPPYVKANPCCPKNRFLMTALPDTYMQKPAIPSAIPLTTVVNNNIHQKKKVDLNIKIDSGTFLLSAYQNGVEDKEEFSSLEDLLCNGSSALTNGDKSPGKRALRSPLKKSRDRGRGIALSKIFQCHIPLVKKCRQPRAKRFPLVEQINKHRTEKCPCYGSDLRDTVAIALRESPRYLHEIRDCSNSFTLYNIGVTNAKNMLAEHFLKRFHLYVPSVIGYVPSSLVEELYLPGPKQGDPGSQPNALDFRLQLPEARLIQYDCGKLQVMSDLLVKLKAGGHRALIFTQMTKVLDILEAFLNYHGFTYLRLDGSTRVEQRQALMERFNGSTKYFCFILSTRSGGVGINLTGADTVIFYDSDWNPTMDAQAQDRCHRIGQTRDVHIYRMVSERTVEENILKKANQKRLLGDLAIEGGNFTTAQLKAQTIKDLFNVDKSVKKTGMTTKLLSESRDLKEPETQNGSKQTLGAYESAIALVEDRTDKEAMIQARKEDTGCEAEFEDIDQTTEDQFSHLASQLSGVERYALKHVEFMERDWRADQIEAAEAELANQRKLLIQQTMSSSSSSDSSFESSSDSDIEEQEGEDQDITSDHREEESEEESESETDQSLDED